MARKYNDLKDKSFGKSVIQNLSGLKDIKISDLTRLLA